MEIFQEMRYGGFETLLLRHNKDANLQMAVAIHDSTLGPALGGIRFYPYPSEEAMVTDVMRLAMGMTYKYAIIYVLSNALIRQGGGKSAIWGNPLTDKTEELLLAAAGVINELDGRYIGAEDMGMDVPEIEIMLRKTRFLVGTQETHYRGGHKGSGAPHPFTALGTFGGVRSCLRSVFRTDDLAPRKFAIQGVGNVGKQVLNYFAVRGAPSNIVVTDLSEESIWEAKRAHPRIRTIPPEDSDEIYDQECDVFVPCAVGGIINDDTIPRLRCKIVAGCANNQLLEPRHGEDLRNRGILYAPDYIINAGGAISAALERQQGGHDHGKATEITEGIGPLLTRIFEEAEQREVPPERVADEYAERVLKNARSAKSF